MRVSVGDWRWFLSYATDGCGAVGNVVGRVSDMSVVLYERYDRTEEIGTDPDDVMTIAHLMWAYVFGRDD
jgi:hypothetical protein